MSVGQRLCVNFSVSRANFLTTLHSHFDITCYQEEVYGRWNGFPASHEVTSPTIIWPLPIIHDQIKRPPILYLFSFIYYLLFLFLYNYRMRRSRYYNLTASNRPWPYRTATCSLSFIFYYFFYFWSSLFNVDVSYSVIYLSIYVYS